MSVVTGVVTGVVKPFAEEGRGKMPSVDVVLDLSVEACLAYYEGRAERVHAFSPDGQRVAFPAVALRRVVTREGVRGIYRLEVSGEGKLLDIRRVARLT